MTSQPNDRTVTESEGTEASRYQPLDRPDALAVCTECGAVIEGDVTGQTRHDVWHADLDRRIADAKRWRPAPQIGGR